MLDETKCGLPKDKLDPTCPPPPPYASHSGSDDDSEKKKPPSALDLVQRNDTKAQQQGKASKGSTSVWGRALRRVVSRVSRHSKNEICPATVVAAAVKTGGQVQVSQEFPKWVGHYGMTCGYGATSTKVPTPLSCPAWTHRYSFDVLFCPPPHEGAYWQQARLCISFNDPSILREAIPWRANLDNHCYKDTICFVNYPYPDPFFLDEPSGKVRAYNYTPCSSTSVGGPTYERTIGLSIQRDRLKPSNWSFTLSLTSRDGLWLASLSRGNTAALIGLDSAIR